jgi:hypothetical protein
MVHLSYSIKKNSNYCCLIYVLLIYVMAEQQQTFLITRLSTVITKICDLNKLGFLLAHLGKC